MPLVPPPPVSVPAPAPSPILAGLLGSPGPGVRPVRVRGSVSRHLLVLVFAGKWNELFQINIRMYNFTGLIIVFINTD